MLVLPDLVFRFLHGMGFQLRQAERAGTGLNDCDRIVRSGVVRPVPVWLDFKSSKGACGPTFSQKFGARQMWPCKTCMDRHRGADQQVRSRKRSAIVVRCETACLNDRGIEEAVKGNPLVQNEKRRTILPGASLVFLIVPENNRCVLLGLAVTYSPTS